jgi:RecG-like helicase
MLGPDSPVTAIRGVGPAKAALLEKLGLRTIRDALFYLPERHEDRIIADLVRDGALLEVARQDAVDLVRDDPKLIRPDHQALRAALRHRWVGRPDLVGA